MSPQTPLVEVAAQLHVSEGTIAVRLHRGKLALRRILTTTLETKPLRTASSLRIRRLSKTGGKS